MDLARLGITIDANGAIQQTQSLGASLDALASKGQSALASLKGAFLGFTGVAAAGFLGREFLKQTIDAQNAMAQLAAAVKSTGGVAQRSVADLDAYSMALQQTTTQSDEAVKGAQAMLLTFDKIRGANFDRATQAITDLAARMGGDLQGAAIQVGKALQDPTTGLTALRRSGVSFSEAQIATIKALYDTGHAAQGQVIILKELEHQFGGSAAAARDTFGGALTGLKNDFGDLFEISKGGSAGAVGAINSLGAATRQLGQHLDDLMHVAEAVAAVYAGRGLQSLNAFVVAQRAQIAATIEAKAITLAANQSELIAANLSLAAAQNKVAANTVLGASTAELAVLEQGVANAQFRVALTAESAAAAELELAAASTIAGRAMATAGAAGAKGLALLGGPLMLLTLAATAASMIIDHYLDKADRLTEAGEAANIALNAPALAAAHSVTHVGSSAFNQAAKDAEESATASAKAMAKLIGAQDQEIAKATALNRAFGQSDLTLKLLTIDYDRQAERAKNAIDHTAAETATLNAKTDALAKQKVIAAQLADAESERIRLNAIKAGNHDVDIEFLIAANLKKQADAAKLVDENLAGVAKQVERIKTAAAPMLAQMDAGLVKAAADAKEMANIAENLTRGMQSAFAGFFENVFTDGLSSVTSFLASMKTLVLKMFAELAAAKLMKKVMDTVNADGTTTGGSKAGATAAAAVGALGVGYGIGSGAESGNKGSSALFGALGGAATGAAIGTFVLPVIGTAVGAAVGAIAGFVGGLLGAAHAADLSAKEMAVLRASLEGAITGIRAQLSGDALGQALATLHEQFEQLRKNAEDAYAYGANEAERNKKLAELNALEAERTAQVKAEAALLQVRAQEDYTIRALVARGHLAEADALSFAEKQSREYAAAVKDSADATTLATLAEAQAAEASAYAAQQARAEGRAQEDATLRASLARGDTGVDALVRAATERREIEDLVAKGATAATIALTLLAQAAEDSAVAAQKAADGQRAMEDLNVETLNAQGKTGAAADLEFALAQQRRLEDAQKNQTAEYVAKLLELQQLQRDSRAAQGLIDSTTGPSSSFAGDGRTSATSATTAVQSTVTERTAYMLVDIGRAQLTTLHEILSTMRDAITGGIGSLSLGDINAGLGQGHLTAGLYAGSVTR